jgi:putative oxidoreductase
MESDAQAWTPRILSVLRIMTGPLFLQHGTAKLLGFPYIASFDKLQLASLLGVLRRPRHSVAPKACQ